MLHKLVPKTCDNILVYESWVFLGKFQQLHHCILMKESYFWNTPTNFMKILPVAAFIISDCF